MGAVLRAEQNYQPVAMPVKESEAIEVSVVMPCLNNPEPPRGICIRKAPRVFRPALKSPEKSSLPITAARMVPTRSPRGWGRGWFMWLREGIWQRPSGRDLGCSRTLHHHG